MLLGVVGCIEFYVKYLYGSFNFSLDGIKHGYYILSLPNSDSLKFRDEKQIFDKV